MSNKIGRNDPCPCGSGKKYKKCHPGEYDTDAVLARSLADFPIHGCWVADDYKEEGLSPVFVVRHNPENGRLVIVSFMCDLFCLGVKDVIFEPYGNQERLEHMLDRQPQQMAELGYDRAREIILGSVKYADSLGFSPHADYEKARPTIEPEKMFKYRENDFGLNGKPFYYAGPHDDYQKVFDILEKNVGRGKFEYELDERTGFSYDG